MEQKHIPSWAADCGTDMFGRWAIIAVRGGEGATPVMQRMRWIEPGNFIMGAPDDDPWSYHTEEEVYAYGPGCLEQPQHEVRISTGFWIFDTPVTQALWTAIMGQNPSRFVSPDHPVENVNWNDAQEFCRRVNFLIPELQLALPTEAQWEYACRAGTTASTYAGDLNRSELYSSPVLDEIAWYGADVRKGTTHPAGLKRPNGWGLYDMLGNVWEWCSDGARWYEEVEKEPVRDPVGLPYCGQWSQRGGCWESSVRNVRASARSENIPGNSSNTGFRCIAIERSE